MKLETRIRQSIKRRSGTVFSRSELASLGSQSQVTYVLGRLVNNGELLRISRGVYAKAKHVGGEVKTCASEDDIIKETAEKLGLKLHRSSFQPLTKVQDRSTVVVETDTPRTNRILHINGLKVILRSHHAKHKTKLELGSSLDEIPTKGIRNFVVELARFHNISYVYNSMDQFADSVTSLAGDDVKHDHVEDLLVALKRAGKLSMQQVARLSINYLREQHGSV